MTRGTWLSWIVSLYVASLFLPAFGGPSHPHHGIDCLLSFPWVFVIAAWWANPLFFVGCCLLGGRHPWTARFCGTLAALLAASFPLTLHDGPDRVHIGYVVWLTSLVLLAIASFSRLGRPSKPARVAGLEDL